jgi:Uma2 family endonuclease
MQSTQPTTNYGTVLPQDDDILYEVVDGKLVELGPMGAHEIWLATVLVVHLANFVRQHQLGRVMQELLFDFTAMVQRKRRPDVAFVSYERWPRQRPVPHAEAWEVVPNLVVEVISPSDKGNDILDKVAEYFRIGVECVWVIFISQTQVYIYQSPTQVRILTRADNCMASRFCRTSGSPWHPCSMKSRRPSHHSRRRRSGERQRAETQPVHVYL